MKYCIVVYKGSEEGWVIMHYSHQYDDAKRWYDKYSLMYASCKLMCDAFVMKEENKKEEFFDFLDQFIEKK